MTMSVYSKTAPAGPFMSFEHLVAMTEMSTRQQVKFAKMSQIQRCCYLIDQHEAEKKKSAKFQSWGDYNPLNLVSNANGAIKSTKLTMDNASDLMEKAKTAITAFSSVVSKVSDVLFGVEISGVMIKVMKVLVNVCMARTSMIAASLLFNISVEFGPYIFRKIKDIFYVKTENSNEAEFQSFNVESFGQLSQFVDSNQGICAAGLGTILATLVMASLGMPQAGDVQATLRFFGERSRNLKSIFDFSKVAMPMFTAIGDYLLHRSFPNLTDKHELDEFLAGYDKWANEVLEIQHVAEPIAVRIEKDEKLVFQIDRLYKKGIEYSGLLGTKKLETKCVAHFHKIFKIIEENRKLCDYTGVFGNRPRVKPLVVHLFGESGVGKSGMSWPLAVDLNTMLCDNAEEAKNFTKEIYFRNTEQEFWDGYNGGNIVIYDDFGQRADSQAAPNEEFMELIRAANIAPYPLHMASLEEKKRTKFCSKVIILTSNVISQNVNSLTYPDAYRRRVDVCGKVINKEEYTKEGNSLASGAMVKRLDREKCDGPVDTSPYLIQLYNAETLQPICSSEDGKIQTLDYENFVKLCAKTLRTNLRDSTEVNVALSNRVTENRFKHMSNLLSGNVSVKYQILEQKRRVISFDSESEDEDYEEAEAPEPPISRKSFARSLKQLVTDNLSCINTIKSVLILVGTLIAGVGLWKFFKGRSAVNSHHHVVGNMTEVPIRNTDRDVALAQTPNLSEEAFASSDPRTVQRKRVQVEATSSADNLTKCNKRVLVEATASADNTTKHAKKILVEAFASADNKTLQKPKVLVESEDVELQAWKDASAQDLITHRILANLYKIMRRRNAGQEQPLLNGLFVRDNIMLTNRHLLNHLEKDDVLVLENIFGSRYEIPFDGLRIEHIQCRDGGYKDAILIQFSRYVAAHSDIVKHFQKMPELSIRRADICVVSLRSLKEQQLAYVLGNARASMSHQTLSIGGGDYTVRNCINYSLNTRDGDCGGPIIFNENSVTRKIAGIHFAAAKDGSLCFGQSVTQNDLLVTLAKFKDVIKTDFDDLAHNTIKSVEFQLEKEYTRDEVRELLRMPANLFGYAGFCDRSIFTPNQTDIRPSIIHGMVAEPTTKPAFLYHNEVNIMNKNIEKCAVNTPYIPDDEVDIAVMETKQFLLSGREKRLARILTFEEAISGSEDSEYIGSINRSTSAGYPWVLNKPAGTHGKTGWLGDNEVFIYNQEVRDCVNKRIDAARRGERLPVTWTATLKDERRPIAKVDALKTRVFANGPMDYTIAVRMYFLGFVAHVMENRVNNEQSIGTNPMGIDWTVTAKKLSTFGRKVFAGDFSTFDGTLNSCILSRFVDVVNEFYNDGEENATIRKVLMLDVYNSVWLCQGNYIALSHSQPSGNPLTTILNSFYNSVSMRIAYYRCARKWGHIAPPFATVVSMVSYGDDNVINFSDTISDWFNQVTVTEAYESFGMTYTDEAKSGECVPWRTLADVAYLKRAFREVNGIYRAPMDLGTLLETPNWIRKCPDYDLACKMNVECTVRELAQHDKSVFDKWSAEYISAYYDQTGEYPEVSTYASYNEEWDRDMGLIIAQ